MQRSSALTRFYSCAHRALELQASDNPAAVAATNRIFSALERSEGEFSTAQPARIPACCHLAPAVEAARDGPVVIFELAKALLDLSPALVWAERAGASAAGEPFLSGHANTQIAGSGGLETRDDVIVGASLLAPNIDYPKHKHAPEEMYIVLSEGDWFNQEAQWYRPGIGAVVYHRPWLSHAMRSVNAPLLAVWCLHVDREAK